MGQRATDPNKRPTKRQIAFCLAVLDLDDQTEAYLRVYGQQPGSSRWKVTKIASRLATQPHMRRYISELQQDAAARAGITRASVLAQISRIATSDIGNLIAADGRVPPPDQIDPDTRAAIDAMTIDEYGCIEYRFANKLAALEMLARHHGLYEPEVEAPVGCGLVRLVAELSGCVVRPQPPRVVERIA